MKLHNTMKSLKWAGVLGCVLLAIQSTEAQVIRLRGAVAFSKAVAARTAAIEEKSGVKIEVVGDGGGRGLLDLNNGQAEIALVAGSLKGVADASNQEKPGSIDAAQMKEILLKTSKTVIFANPSIGVKSLTDAQVSAVLAGKVTNWKEVGGADLPIKVVLPFVGDGSRIIVQSTFFPGVEYAKTAIVRNSAKDLCGLVAQLAGACSMTGFQNLEGNVVVVATEKDILIPWLLVTKGEPSGDTKKVVEAVMALVK